MKEDLVALVINTLRETNGYQTSYPAVLRAETCLFGEEGILDSLGLVSLIVAVEQAIEDRFGMSISLTDEKAMSQRHSPFKTVDSLATFAQRVLEGKE